MPACATRRLRGSSYSAGGWATCGDCMHATWEISHLHAPVSVRNCEDCRDGSRALSFVLSMTESQRLRQRTCSSIPHCRPCSLLCQAQLVSRCPVEANPDHQGQDTVTSNDGWGERTAFFPVLTFSRAARLLILHMATQFD